MQQIAEWLEGLGLSDYLPRFVENHVDISVLRDLTDQDLRELGVLLGDRRKILRAIAALSPAAFTFDEHRAPDVAERRQVSVLFCDLVGSTALSARLDPEDLRAIMAAYHHCCKELIERSEGFVAEYLGDGVLAYFGYPKAHEQDAELAVQCGLALVEAVSSLAPHAGSPLSARIGIATGITIIGDRIGSGDTHKRGIAGVTPNLAARLQSLAEPNMVIIAESTRKLLGNLFDIEDLGPQNLKDGAAPARAWAVLRRSSFESRFEALHATGLIPLIGRDEECELLLRRWRRAKSGEGQVVLLCGEAGIGKSRLASAFLERLAGERQTRLRYFCSPQRTDSALYPITDQLERAAGLTHDDEQSVKLDKLDTLLAQTSTSAEDRALMAEMLSLPNDGRNPPLDPAPHQRRRKTLDALVAQIESLARANPVLMVFEDAHWIDPTSVELLGLVIARIQSLAVLLVMTFRSEFSPPWIGRPHVTALTINRLAQRDVDAMIDRVSCGRNLPLGIRRDIIERTDGIPLFIEEMTKAVLESDSEQAAKGVLAAAASATVVPASLHASLMTRLDRLGPAKEAAQIGAAIGREFSHDLLSAVAQKPQAELDAALDRLIEAGMLFRQGAPPHATYLFKHALVQDAAYGALLRERRRILHARICSALEGQFETIAESQPELLAHHCTEANLIERACALWGVAGERSLARSALVEAAEQLTRALAQLESLVATPELRRKQIELQVALANALMPAKGHAAPETKACVDRAHALMQRAEALGEAPDDPLVVCSLFYGSWVRNFIAFNGDVPRAIAARFMALAQSQGDAIPLTIAHRLLGTSLLHAGDIAQGRRSLDCAIALYDPAGHRSLATRVGVDSRMAALSYRSWASWLLGSPAAALTDAARTVEHAREFGHAPTLMHALTITSLTCILCGAAMRAKALLDEHAHLADDKGALFWKLVGRANRGCLLATIGENSAAASILTSTIAEYQSTGSAVWTPLWLAHLASACGGLGQFDEARGYAAEAIASVEQTGERWCEAEIWRVAGEIALMSLAPGVAEADAEANFERALAVARAQGAKSWELRAASSLARLWRDQGKRSQALEVLRPVYNGFSEGFDTRDLIKAKELNEALA
jgi:class 3 adenylate cyclase/tetratricopeptide (TPR) repeat protein